MLRLRDLEPTESLRGTKENPLTYERLKEATQWMEERAKEVQLEKRAAATSGDDKAYFQALSAEQSIFDLQEYRNRILAGFGEERPIEYLALLAGVRDKSFSNPNSGRCFEYDDIGFVRMNNGDLWKCEGHAGRGGNPWVRGSEGYISFEKVK